VDARVRRGAAGVVPGMVGEDRADGSRDPAAVGAETRDELDAREDEGDDGGDDGTDDDDEVERHVRVLPTAARASLQRVQRLRGKVRSSLPVDGDDDREEKL